MRAVTSLSLLKQSLHLPLDECNRRRAGRRTDHMELFCHVVGAKNKPLPFHRDLNFKP
jgi:hypothetical protein